MIRGPKYQGLLQYG